MNSSRSKQELENSLVRLKRDVMILSIKKYTLTKNSLHVIETLDKHIPEMITHVRAIYEIEKYNETEKNVKIFLEFLMNVLEEALGVANLQQVIIDDEIELLAMVKNEFVDIIRTVQKQIVHEI